MINSLPHKNSFALVVAMVFSILLGPSAAQGQTTGFTYQGRLTDSGTAANGNYDLKFALWDSLTNGAQVGSTQTLSTVAVNNGVFTVSLDFGPNAFTGASRFLEISARSSGAGSFTLLTPRQPITSTPYAVRSASAATADTATNATNATNATTATNATNATSATNATQLGGVAASQYVQTSDSRLSDPRPPTPGSSNYIQNTGSPQAANFNISGNGIVGGNAGIGTTAPLARLDVRGDVYVGLAAAPGFLPGNSMYVANDSGDPRNSFRLDGFLDNLYVVANSGVGSSSGTGIIFRTAVPGGGEVDRVVINSAGNVGIGTGTPQARLDVRGDIKLGGSGQFFATSGEENLRIVRGTVDLNGNILAGSGFLVSHPFTGEYFITFNTPFATAPSVTATIDGNGARWDILIQTWETNRFGFNISTYEPGDVFAGFHSFGFNFIAVGPR